MHRRAACRRNPFITTGAGRVVALWEPISGPLELKGLGNYTVEFAPTFSPRMFRAGQTLQAIGSFGGKALPFVGAAVDIGLAYNVISDPNSTSRQKHVAQMSAMIEISAGFIPVVGFAAPFVAPYIAEGSARYVESIHRLYGVEDGNRALDALMMSM
jgi:hypothetical protein